MKANFNPARGAASTLRFTAQWILKLSGSVWPHQLYSGKNRPISSVAASQSPQRAHETSAQDFLLCPGPDRGRT